MDDRSLSTNRIQTGVMRSSTLTVGKGNEYYFGVPGTASDAWPSVSPTVKTLKIGKKANEYQHFEFTSIPLNLTVNPSTFCIPEELLKYHPTNDQIFKYFFKGTPKEVSIRQIFFHTELTEREQEWLTCIRDYCRWKNFPIRPCLEPFLLRLCYYNWRKNGDKAYLPKAYEHIIETVNWRAKMFPMSDADPEILEDLNRGVMYWTARDSCFRPLLIVRLRRLPRSTTPDRFKRLTVFCFEWGMRYLFVPGLVETCIVVFDVRGIPIHSFPMSALSDMTNTLTRQYPFRLDRMFIINDSLFIQTVWSIARQFLTEVQQQKMNFMRTGYAKELLKEFAPHQLETEFGGSREEFKTFYPFPLAPGPFEPTATGPNPNAIPNCYRAVSEHTTEGKVWEGNTRPPIPWSSDAIYVFKECHIPLPFIDTMNEKVENGIQTESQMSTQQDHVSSPLKKLSNSEKEETVMDDTPYLRDMSIHTDMEVSHDTQTQLTNEDLERVQGVTVMANRSPPPIHENSVDVLSDQETSKDIQKKDTLTHITTPVPLDVDEKSVLKEDHEKEEDIAVTQASVTHKKEDPQSSPINAAQEDKSLSKKKRAKWWHYFQVNCCPGKHIEH